jgi:hypothetical protein
MESTSTTVSEEYLQELSGTGFKRDASKGKINISGMNPREHWNQYGWD